MGLIIISKYHTREKKGGRYISLGEDTETRGICFAALLHIMMKISGKKSKAKLPITLPLQGESS